MIKAKTEWYSEHFAELLDVIHRAAGDKKLLVEFLLDLWTPTEIKEMSKRWQIVKMLDKNVPQHKIARKLKVAVATVSRGAREMSNREGGFQQMLKKLGY